MATNTLLNVLNSIILEICGGGVELDQNSKNFFLNSIVVASCYFVF